jgi:predicted TIM-barrel fold metal-dependent hydrolase/predicted GNAT family acetyltransferase
MMEIIDAHVHIGIKSHQDRKSGPPFYNLFNDYKSFIRCMDEAHVSRAVVFPIPHRDFNSRRSNEYIITASQKSSGRLIPFCRIDDNLENNLLEGFRGVKLHLVYEDLEIKNLKCELKLIEDYNVPLLVHAKFKNKVRQIEEILKYAPNIYLILAHMGRGHINTDEEIVENAEALKKYDRVFFETSTVEDPTSGDGKSIRRISDIISNDRVIFGTDYPFEKNKYSYQQRVEMVLNSGFNKTLLENVMYKNIFNLLNLNNNTTRVFIRRVKKTDSPVILNLLNSLSGEDKNFLALSLKTTLIKNVIRSERHCYVALMENNIVGFMRESGRPEGYSLLEEIAVHHDYRRRGIAQKLLEYYHRIFSKTQAKTNAKNAGMIALLRKNGYTADNPAAPRIVNWSRNASDTK